MLARQQLVAAGHQASGYTADYTRYQLPPDAAAPGELVEVVGEEPHADGVRAYPVCR